MIIKNLCGQDVVVIGNVKQNTVKIFMLVDQDIVCWEVTTNAVEPAAMVDVGNQQQGKIVEEVD